MKRKTFNKLIKTYLVAVTSHSTQPRWPCWAGKGYFRRQYKQFLKTKLYHKFCYSLETDDPWSFKYICIKQDEWRHRSIVAMRKRRLAVGPKIAALVKLIKRFLFRWLQFLCFVPKYPQAKKFLFDMVVWVGKIVCIMSIRRTIRQLQINSIQT